jgi:prolyl oligopeptidase PreP (S9A serine peptidase family)
MGNMYTMRPDLWGAIHCAVPLLDMKRYHTLLAGASWMAEYGDPDTDDWEFLQKFSPYHSTYFAVETILVCWRHIRVTHAASFAFGRHRPH